MRVFRVVLPPLLLAACNMSPSPTDTSIMSSTDSTQRAEALTRAGVAPRPVDDAGLRPAAIDTSKRFEYVDLYVSLGDPTGQRQLAPYLLQQDVWTLDRFENLSDTLRHYRFRRIVGPDGKALPSVDPFNPPQKP